MAPARIMAPFNNLVAEAIVAHSKILPEELVVLDNSAKYCPGGIKQNENDEATLSEIFGIMAKLNQAALENVNLCAGQHGPSFRDALFLAAGELVILTKGRPIRYVELGPEPSKSKALLSGMLAAGVEIQQYIGVDINPKSEKTMRKTLIPIIGAERFTYWIQDFYKASASDYPKLSGDAEMEDDCITIITNLGFQEGNDLPSRIGPMLSCLSRPGDLLLSEMQVFHGCDTSDGVSGIVQEAEGDPIWQFYLLPEMRRFSALVGQKFRSRSPSASNAASDSELNEHLFILVPVETEVGFVNVATTLVAVWVNEVKKFVLTNSCLKYTPDQFKKAREASGDFVVKASQETGDKSVVFQISERQ